MPEQEQQEEKKLPSWRELFAMSSHIKEKNPVDDQVNAMGSFVDLAKEIEKMEDKLAKDQGKINAKKAMLSGLLEEIMERAPFVGQIIVDHEKTLKKLTELGNGSMAAAN